MKDNTIANIRKVQRRTGNDFSRNLEADERKTEVYQALPQREVDDSRMRGRTGEATVQFFPASLKEERASEGKRTIPKM